MDSFIRWGWMPAVGVCVGGEVWERGIGHSPSLEKVWNQGDIKQVVIIQCDGGWEAVGPHSWDPVAGQRG